MMKIIRKYEASTCLMNRNRGETRECCGAFLYKSEGAPIAELRAWLDKIEQEGIVGPFSMIVWRTKDNDHE